MLDKLTIDDFTDLVGHTFQVSPLDPETEKPIEDAAFELELRRADVSPFHEGESEEQKKERERVPFSLEFHSRLPDHVPQQTFGIEHEKLGKFPLFLVPLGPDAEGHRYEAVFA